MFNYVGSPANSFQNHRFSQSLQGLIRNKNQYFQIQLTRDLRLNFCNSFQEKIITKASFAFQQWFSEHTSLFPKSPFHRLFGGLWQAAELDFRDSEKSTRKINSRFWIVRNLRVWRRFWSVFRRLQLSDRWFLIIPENSVRPMCIGHLVHIYTW